MKPASLGVQPTRAWHTVSAAQPPQPSRCWTRSETMKANISPHLRPFHFIKDLKCCFKETSQTSKCLYIMNSHRHPPKGHARLQKGSSLKRKRTDKIYGCSHPQTSTCFRLPGSETSRREQPQQETGLRGEVELDWGWGGRVQHWAPTRRWSRPAVPGQKAWKRYRTLAGPAVLHLTERGASACSSHPYFHVANCSACSFS